MNKTTLVTILFVLSVSTSLAGEFSGIGMKLGYNSSTFSGDDIPGKGVKSQSGLAIGGFFGYKFNQKFSLQQEILFTTKGAKINTIGDVYLSNLFMYFEFPLLVKMTFRPEQMFRPIVFLGPAFGINILAVNDTAVLEDIRSIDFGIVLGIGIEIWRFALDVRLYEGLLNFDQSAGDIDLKNRTISIVTGYSF
jgi:hypothetical protein